MDNLNIEDPVNIAGMSFLIDTSNAKKNFDPQEIEQQIMSGPRGGMSKKVNPADEIDDELNRLIGPPHQSTPRDYRFTQPSNSRPFEPAENDIDKLLKSLEDDGSDADDDDDGDDGEGGSTVRFSDNQLPSSHKDPYMNYMTNEEKRQNVIGEVFKDFNKGSDVAGFSIEKEKEEDDKARKLEQICFLRETLEEEGEDLSRIPNVGHQNSLEEVDGVLRLLLLKNDRKRCCTFAEECVLLGAHGIEWLFDGRKEYFGFKPDMVDWHKSVAVKLRRMRHDTSNVVSNIMQAYNLGSGTRIMLELIPSMFLYSKMRKSQHRDNIISDDEFNAGISHLRDYDAPSSSSS